MPVSVTQVQMDILILTENISLGMKNIAICTIWLHVFFILRDMLLTNIRLKTQKN